MAEKKKRARSERFSSPVVEFHHCYIYRPDAKDAEGAGEFADDKYKVSGYIEKERVEELRPVKQTILKVAREEWGKETTYKELEHPFHDGDEKLADVIEKIKKDEKKRYKNEKEKEEAIKRATDMYAGKIYFTAKSKKKPGVVGADTKELPEGEDVQSTDTGRLRLTAYAYERPVTEIINGKKKTRDLRGVSLSLEGIQKKETGPRPFAQGDGSKEFDALEVEGATSDDDVAGDEDFEEEKTPPKSEKKSSGKPAKEETPADDDDEII